jgi:putative transposase
LNSSKIMMSSTGNARQEQGQVKPKRKGRPRLAAMIRELVIKLAKESGWGYTRILGELRKLKVGPISRQSIKNILIENGFEPGPKRGMGTWSEFIEIHKDTLWQIDFFSKYVWTRRGPRQIFALAAIHIGTREEIVTPGTFNPNAGWMETQVHDLLEYTEHENLDCSIIIRDFDGKYSRVFDQIFKDRKIKVKPVGPRAPNLNAFIERWVQSIKFEALNHFICFGREHFDHIVACYVAYYNRYRPHQGIGNVLLPRPGKVPQYEADGDEAVALPLDLDEIKCETSLGGLLRHYYREAA